MAKRALRPRFLAPGDKLGKFELIRQIAVGGMAELYLARTMGIEGFEKLVVVKRILPQYINNPSFVNMFLNEARLSATLHHPNITQVYDIGVEEGDYFFSMEYVHGEDLGRLAVTALENGVPISLDCALTLVAGLCAGLHYAHEKAGPDGKPLNVVHRDVSPSNVLVSYDGAVKLVDFGIARAGSNPATTRGGLKGKISYMSPEQCRGNAALDRRSDVFSIGTILYELTTGQLPFTDETEYGVLNQIVNNDVPPPSTLVPNYPPALEAIVVRALSRDPDTRFKSALELQGQIEDFAHENRLRVSPLVLARLMSNLFPARLEEWDHARAQGAFFVEQHVLRTLIESGKTNDNTAVTAQIALAASAPAKTPAPKTPIPAAEDETTDVVELRPMDTSVGAAPAPAASDPVLPSAPALIVASTASRSPTPIPIRTTPMPPPRPTPLPGQLSAAASRPDAENPFSQVRTLAPVPGVPGAVPIMPIAASASIGLAEPVVASSTSLTPLAIGTGTLVSNRAPSDAIVLPMSSAAVDVTERVRVPMPMESRDDTAFVRPPRSRLPVIFGVGISLAAAGIAIALLVGRGGASPDQPTVVQPASTAPDQPAALASPEPTAKPPEPMKVEPAVAKDPDPIPSTPEAAVEPTVEDPPELVKPDVVKPDVVEPAVVKPAVMKPAVAKPAVAKPAVAKPAVAKPAVARPAVAKPAVAKPAVAKPTVAKPAVAKPAIAKPAVKKPEVKPEPKKDPKKEPAWNAESPFMPVRTEKK